MSTPILATKLYIPPPRPKVVRRPRLIERLNEGLHRKLTLISAPAGFGKTTLIAEWIAGFSSNVESSSNNQKHSTFNVQPAFAWLSLDEGDNDSTRFLVYLIAVLQSIDVNIPQGVLSALQSPQPPPAETILISLINEIAALSARIVLILDDYHLVEAQPIHDALTYLLVHLPRQMHLVIATREDPHLPLSRLRARGELTELRAADLRFIPGEAATFLNQVMGLNLSEEDITALESRTEGWIAGLQLAALSMHGSKDVKGFINSFTGSHRHVWDYLVEEVLEQQPESLQTFMLQTAIVELLNGSLCDAITGQEDGQATLEYLERANLFLVPLDSERRWYRYHHLFADLLRQRLQQQQPDRVAEYHSRASQWYEDNGLELEAFHHAAAANDVERAARLLEGGGLPLHFRGAMTPVLNWLASLPAAMLDARPALWVMYASASTMAGQPVSSVEEKLQAAEAVLPVAGPQGTKPDARIRDLIGHIAAIRAMLAIPQNQAETILTQSQRALEYLHPDNLPVRTNAAWTLGFAYHLQGDRAAASQAYTEAISISQASGNIMVTIAATTLLGQVQEAENQLYLAAESYRRVLQLAGDPPLPAACEAQLGLARVCNEWNDLDAAQQHGQQSLQLARQLETVDTPATAGVFLARLKLARGDAAGAAAILSQAEQFVRQHNFVHRMPDVAAAQVLVLLRHGKLAAAADLAEQYELPLSLARVRLAQVDPSAALAALEPVRRQAEARGWEDERLKIMVLQALAVQAQGETEEAVQVLGDALALAEPGGFIRIFVDEGLPMARLLLEALSQGTEPDYVRRLLGAFPETGPEQVGSLKRQALKFGLVESLSERELEVLQLIAEGLTNQEIASRLYLSLNTVKVHTRNINAKLGVSSRTKAVARARALGILPSI